MADPKIALVTGSSTGIGLDASIQLAVRGVQVVATMRDTSKQEALLDAASRAGVSVLVLPCDVTDSQSMQACVEATLQKFGRIDVLINNAGHGQEGTLEELSMDELRRQMEVNFFGAAEMTKLVLPHMRAAGVGRIVSVSSIAGAIGQPFNDAYCASKFALEGLMQSLSITVSNFGVTVSVVEPGPVSTPFLSNSKPVDTTRLESDPYGELRSAYLTTTAEGFRYAQSSASCAEVVVEAALTSDWKFRWQTSKMATSLVGFSLSDLDGSVVEAKVGSWLTA